MDKCCQVFQALSDKTRVEILNLLKKKEICVSDICQCFDMTQPSISHHLDMLKRCGLVTSEKRGREVYYKFNGKMIIACCGEQFGRLDIVIKKKKK